MAGAPKPRPKPKPANGPAPRVPRCQPEQDVYDAAAEALLDATAALNEAQANYTSALTQFTLAQGALQTCLAGG